MQHNINKVKKGGDIVSKASSIAKKIGIPLKNWHLPGHNFTGEKSNCPS